MTEEYDLEIYSTATGKEPFNIWMASLKDKKAKTSVLLRLQRIRQGNFGDCKALKDGLHELRGCLQSANGLDSGSFFPGGTIESRAILN